MNETATLESRIAHLNESSLDDYEHIVHGVAHGEGELTLGQKGPKYWPPEEVQRAAATLEGKPVVTTHGDSREEIGAVLRSGYQEGVGVVYEAGLNDAEVANELSLGQREVSIEAGNPSSVDEHEETGAAILREYEYTALATPEKGASEGNYTAAGSADENPAVAALSASSIEGALNGDQPDDPEMGEVTDSDGNEPAESGADSDTTNMGDEPTETEDGPDVEALLERVDEKDDRIDELEAELSEKEEEITEVKQSYAAALAGADTMLDEEDFVEKFTVAELRERVDAREDAELAASEPEVQTGGGSGEETAELSAEEEGRVEEIEAHLSDLPEDSDNLLVEKQREQYENELAELRGDN